MMLGDGDAAFTKAIGLDKETGSFGGVRSQRYAMIIENGVVTELAVEAVGEFEVSKAESILEKL
jgi:peroxiredoxin